MRIGESDVSTNSLASHARRAAALLQVGAFAQLVDAYGYAVANGRDPVEAVREDFERALFGSGQKDHGLAVFHAGPSNGVELKIYKANNSALVATYEGIEVAQCGDRVAVLDFVIFGNPKSGLYLSIEDIYERSFAA